MADRAVVVRLRAEIADFQSKMRSAAASTKQFGDETAKSAAKHKADWTKIGAGATAAGLAIGAGVGVAVKAYADFDAEMSNVRAVSGATASEMKALTAAARDAGAGTKFSATEAAQATAELAKVGISTKEILGGALSGALSLAAAGNLDLARAAEVSGQAMKIFNLQGKDVGTVADALASGANKSAADVEDLAQALAQGGLVAAQTGLTMENTVGALSMFADNALKGSDAGTSLKTMLQRLTPQSDEAASAMDEIGLKAYDAQGNFVGLEGVAGQLQEGLSGLTAEQRNATLATIFGSDAVRAASVLYKEGAAGVREYDLAVRDYGAAARQAAIMQDNLKGDVEKLTGAIDDLFIGLGAGADGPLRGFVQGLTGAVDAIGNLPAPVQKAALGIGAVASAALLAGGAALMLIPRLVETQKALKSIGIWGPSGAKGLASFGKAAGIATVALVALAAADRGFNNHSAIGAKGLAKDLTGAADAVSVLNDRIREAGEVAKGYDSRIGSVSDTLRASFDPSHWEEVGNNFGKIWSAFGGENNSDLAVASQRLQEMDAALAQMASGGNTQGAVDAFKQIAAEAATQGITVEQLTEKFPQYAEAVEAAHKTSSDATKAQSAEMRELQEATEAAQQAQIDMAQAVVDAANAILAASNSDIALAQAHADLAEKAEKLRGATTRNKEAFDLTKESGREAQSALNTYAAAARQSAEDSLKAGDSVKSVDTAMQTARAAFIENATRMGISSSAARTMADKFGLSTKGVVNLNESLGNLPASKTVKVNVNGVDGALAAVDRLRIRIAGLNGKTVTITQRVVNTTAGQAGGSTQGGITRAAGGPVYGPGTATSDSIPAMLSNGEHVLTAADVQKAGGQEAIYRMRKMIQSGTLRFASGGAVQPFVQPTTIVRAGISSGAAGAGAAGGDVYNLYGMKYDAAGDVASELAFLRRRQRRQGAYAGSR